jgi:hypothetical protein
MNNIQKYKCRLKKSTIDIKCKCGLKMKLSKYPSHSCNFTNHRKRNVCPWACEGKIRWKQVKRNRIQNI